MAPIPEETTLGQAPVINQDVSLGAKLGDQSTIAVDKTAGQSDFSLGLQNTLLQDPSLDMNPLSAAPPSVPMFSPNPPAVDTDPETMFNHIDLAQIDDDKKRENCMIDMITTNMEATCHIYDEPEASFFTLATSQDRKRAARQFYSLLVLRKQKIIEVEQEEPLGDIKIRKNVNFDQGKVLVAVGGGDDE